MQEGNKKTAENVTKQIETLATKIIIRDQERDKDQQNREIEREAELKKRDAKQQKQTQNLLETFARRITETEKKMQTPNYNPGNWTAFGRERKAQEDDSIQNPPEPPDIRRGREAYIPKSIISTLGKPTTLEGQLCRGDITQAKYDRSVAERKPLIGKTEEARLTESMERDQLLRDRIYARRQEVATEHRLFEEKRRRERPAH